MQLLDFTFLHLPVRGLRGQGQGSSHTFTALCGGSSERGRRQPSPACPEGNLPPRAPFPDDLCLLFSDCRSCTCRKTASSCWRTRPWRGSPHWHCWTSAGISWAPSAVRPYSPWPACKSFASQVPPGGKGPRAEVFSRSQRRREETNRPRCGAGSGFGGSELQPIREHSGGPHHSLHPCEEADGNAGAGRGTAQGTSLRKTVKVQVPGRS